MVDWSFHPFLGGPRKCLGGEFLFSFSFLHAVDRDLFLGLLGNVLVGD